MATVPSWPVMPSTRTLVGTPTVVRGTTASLHDRNGPVNRSNCPGPSRWGLVSNHTPICGLCGSPLTRTHTGDLDAWVCPTGHGLAMTLSEAYVVAQEDELAVLWERGKSAAAGIRRCPMCETAMTVVSLGVDDDDEQPEGAPGDGQATSTVKVDLCAPCQVLWFDGNELAGLPTDQPEAAPVADELAHVAEIRRLFGEGIEAAGEARGHNQLAERLISFAARKPSIAKLLHKTPVSA